MTLGYNTALNVKTFGAKGDWNPATTSGTDDQAAIQRAMTAAIAAGNDLHFPPGNYKISKFIDVVDARNLRIRGSAFSTITYPSDDTGVSASGGAASDAQARSAFLTRYCTNVTVENVVFQGGTHPSFDLVNTGVCLYETHTQGTRFVNCQAYDGNSLHQQDAQLGTAATGDSLAFSGGTVTLTNSSALFRAGHLGKEITISNATNPANNGVYVITGVTSTTVVTFLNAAGINETSSFYWQVDDGDRDTVIQNCRSQRCRSVVTVPSHSKILDCHFRQPMTPDLTGIPSKFVSGSPVVMSAVNGTWDGSAVGKYVYVQGSTSSANDGLYKITAATARSRFVPATISYTNGGAVTEAAAATSTFIIFGGEKTGKGNGATALAKSGSNVTLTATVNSFHASDIGKVVRIAIATTSGNNGAFIITAVPAANQITFVNSLGASETFAGAWSVDGHDACGAAGAAFGSTHAIYVFAGREDIEVANCTFVGVRKNCVKASGSTLPVRGIRVHDCHAVECGALWDGGADDANEHAELHCDGNTLIDVATGRPGWSEAIAIGFLGCKGASADRNHFYYTKPAVSACDGRNTIAGLACILAARYNSGKTQPLEDFSACGNKATADRVNTNASIVTSSMIVVTECGLNAYWGGSGATFTFSTPIVTLVDSTAAWSQDLVGSKIQILNATTGGNNGTFTVLSVTGTGSLTFSNASGAAEALPLYGVYRIKRTTATRGGTCKINHNESDGAATVVVTTTSCVGPEIVGNIMNGGSIALDSGSVTPRIAGNRLVSASGLAARIQVGSNTAWPVVYDNIKTADDIYGGALVTPEVPGTPRHDVGIGVDNFTIVDHPLLGKRGRVCPTGGKPEAVFAFGSKLVEGDTFSWDGVAITYTDNPAPAYPKFHTLADLVTAFATPKSGVTIEDYGTRFHVPVTTGHGRFFFAAASASTGVPYLDTVNVLNPTALVFMRNATGGGESYLAGVGEEVSTSDVHIPIWSPLAGFGGVVMTADKSPTGTATTGAALLAGGWYVNPDIVNTGAVQVVTTVLAATGNEELRWELP